MPAAKLRAIGKVSIFGERIVLPAARVFDRGAAPDAGSSVEIKKDAAAKARGVLDGEVAVEQDCFDFSELGVVAVDIRPAGLDHCELWVSEIGSRAAQKVGGRNEVGVEDGDKLPCCGFETFP